MKAENLRQKIRELAHLLAFEEMSECRLKGWYERKCEHGRLLAKLYKIEKKI